MAKKKTEVKKKTAKKTVIKKTAVRKKPVVLSSKQFALAAAKIALERRCKDAVALDLTGISPAADYFIIATGSSDRQTKTVADEIAELGKKNNFELFGKAGYEQGKWILLDFVDVVVHLFDEEFRQYYDLELLWGDAKKLKI